MFNLSDGKEAVIDGPTQLISAVAAPDVLAEKLPTEVRPRSAGWIPVSVKKTLLRRRRPLGKLAWKAPKQGLERSFCCCFAGQRLT